MAEEFKKSVQSKLDELQKEVFRLNVQIAKLQCQVVGLSVGLGTVSQSAQVKAGEFAEQMLGETLSKMD